jgi:hypothetical protein
MGFRRVTPLHVVDTIEPVLAFWTALGFQALVEVPHGEGLGFVLLAAGDVHVMLQSKASLAADLPAIARLEPQTLLYADVDSLEGALAAVPSVELLVPERQTSYGPKEAAVRAPSGHVVLFAQER